MSGIDVYKQLSKKLMMENSELLPKIWNFICDPEEAEILNALPGTAEELAKRFKKSTDEMNDSCKSLFHRGAVFDYVRDGKTYYRIPRNIVQFHDASILWPEAPAELNDLWVEFMNEEFPKLLELVQAVKLPSFMRVLPINKTIESKNQVLVHEDAVKLVENAKTLAVTSCVCRKSIKKCDAPIEVCVQLNKGAEYQLKRGTGRKIDVKEAIEILKISEDAGLVHMTDNRAGKVNAICNCCHCCCQMLIYAKGEKTKGVTAPSRFQPFLEEENCNSCGNCIDICPMDAISIKEDNPIAINLDDCIGCGLCATTCITDAIYLKQTRPEDFIPL